MALVRAALGLVQRQAEVVVLGYAELFQAVFGVIRCATSEQRLRAALGEGAIDPQAGTRRLVDLLMTHRLQPGFPRTRITVIHDWSASQCALAKIRPGIRRWPSASSSISVRTSWPTVTTNSPTRPSSARERQRAPRRGQAAVPIDESLLAALAAGLPACGRGLGWSAPAHASSGSDDLRALLAFDFARA